MAKRINVFYAYPEHPASGAETINLTLRELNDSRITREGVKFKPWPAMSVGGKSVISTVAENIQRSDIFACDLTYANFNVAFELGYAIGRFKRIWISLDTSVEGAKRDYKRLYSSSLGDLGYEPYENHKELVSALLTKPPWVDINSTPLGALYRQQAGLEENPTLLWVRPPIDTEAVVSLSNLIPSSVFGQSTVIDDPRENVAPYLEWYAGKIRTSDAILVQLLAENQRSVRDHNIKCSIVAGLAYGFGKPLLIVAARPYEPPADYLTLLKIHDTAQECVELVKRWFGEVGATMPLRRSRRPLDRAAKKTGLELTQIVDWCTCC